MIFLIIKLAAAKVRQALNHDMFIWGFICGEIFIAIIYKIIEALP